MSKRVRGTGTVYQRGRVWWIQYAHRGEVYRESSRSSERADAVKLLKRRYAEVDSARMIGPSAEKITLGEMAAVLMNDYRLKGNRSIRKTEFLVANLLDFFGEKKRAIDVTSDKVDAYIEHRRKQGRAGGTINRETCVLRRMFRLMVKARRLSHDHVPSFTHVAQNPPRQGFLEPAEFSQLHQALPEHLRNPIEFMYVTGWRAGAMRALEWSRDTELELDESGEIVGGTLHLQPEFAKNKRHWTLKLRGALIAIMRRAWESRSPECPFIFQHDGAPIASFRKSWATACRSVGLDSLRPHDMRRSCTRNLVRAGVPERVAMNVTGHITRSIFDRYNIVSEGDLESAMERVSAYIEQRAALPPKVVALKPRKRVA